MQRDITQLMLTMHEEEEMNIIAKEAKKEIKNQTPKERQALQQELDALLAKANIKL